MAGAGEKTPIGFVRHHFLPPSETFIYTSLRALEDFEVRVLTLRRDQPERFPHHDVTVLPLASALRYRATTESRQAFRWARSVRLVHAQFGNAGVHALRLARAAGVPLVVSFYGKDVTAALTRTRFNPAYWHYVVGQKRLLAEADRILVLSEHMAAALRAQGAPAERVRIVPLGVDVTRFAAAASARRERPSDAPLGVLMVGREVDKKGFDDGLRACARAIAQGARLSVSILGTGGPLRGAWAALGERLGLAVRWLDPRSRVAAAMAEHDVLLVPSRTARNGDQEGTPTVICEGSAAGLAIVATRHAGIPEQVEHQVTGLLADERDVETMAAALVRLACTPGLATTLGARGVERMRERYSLEAHRDRLQAIYRELLAT